ncbi:MAG: thiamine-phosphate kinase [Burkholderiales bacterium]
MSSEFDLIRRHFARPRGTSARARLGIGDDAALLRAPAGAELAVTTDTLVEGVHFLRGTHPGRLGHKALAVNLSDLAAMGATPRYALLALTLPKADPRWLTAFSEGFFRLARRYGVELVGGDTTRGPLSITITAIGEVPAGQALRRDGAKPGDDIWVTGTLGDAAIGLAALQGRIRLTVRDRQHCVECLEMPQPRLVVGRALRGVASAAIDLSDGLAADLGHLCERSKLAADVWLDHVPRPDQIGACRTTALAREVLLAGGDDYELLFTAPPRMRMKIERAGFGNGVMVTRVGKITRGPAGRVRVYEGSTILRLPRGGYDHFR